MNLVENEPRRKGSVHLHWSLWRQSASESNQIKQFVFEMVGEGRDIQGGVINESLQLSHCQLRLEWQLPRAVIRLDPLLPLGVRRLLSCIIWLTASANL